MYTNLSDDNTREIFFDVTEEEVVGLQSNQMSPDKKMLLKNGNDYLSIVNRKYRVVTNREILIPLQEQMINYFDSNVTDDIQIKDTITGATCLSQYIFPKISREITTTNGHNTTFGLRYIMKNSFDGSGSVTLYAGMIDFFCTNGMIRGEYDVARRRHTKNFSLDGFLKIFETSIERFDADMKLYQEYADKKVSSINVKKLFETLVGTKPEEERKRSGGLAEKLFAQYLDEVQDRGSNAFSVMSTLTNFASHDSERFGISKAGDEGTLFKRQERVSNWMFSKTWEDFLVAA